MASKVVSFSYDDDRDAGVVEWLKAQSNASSTVLTALRLLMERESGAPGAPSQREMIEKILEMVESGVSIPTGIELEDVTDDDLSYMDSAASFLDGL